MKVRFLQAIAGPNWGASPRDVREVDNDEAVRLINAEIAEAAEDHIATIDVTRHEGGETLLGIEPIGGESAGSPGQPGAEPGPDAGTSDDVEEDDESEADEDAPEVETATAAKGETATADRKTAKPRKTKRKAAKAK